MVREPVSVSKHHSWYCIVLVTFLQVIWSRP